MAPEFGIIVFPGSNCDHDSYYALKHELGAKTRFIWHKEEDIGRPDAIIIPGGFSYGDYLRSGAIARFSPVMNPVMAFAENGGPVMGICNGFQVLLEAGLLPGTMLPNAHLRFSCKHVHLYCRNPNTMFSSRVDPERSLQLPIAHGDGNYYTTDEGLKKLYDRNQIVFQYADEYLNISPDANPNGSIDNIAGICNEQGNVLGLMPHPERAVDPALGSDDGRALFESLLYELAVA